MVDGGGSAIHLVGEPGIGKSSLLAYVERQAAGCCLVRTATAEDTDQRRGLECAAQLFSPAVTVGADDPIGTALDFIEGIVASQPLVLLADDVQWADGASLGVLTAIARRAEELGVVLLTAARRSPWSVDLAHFEAAIDRFGRRVALDAMSIEEVSDLVVATLGAPPERVLIELLEGADGNPFLIVELLRALEREGSLQSVDGAMGLVGGASLPPGLGERFAREAIAASKNDSLLIRAAAVIPGGFMAEELAHVLNRPVVEVLTDLLDLTEGGVISERQGRLGFRHDIIRQAILGATPSPVVRSLNRRAVEVLTETKADPARIASSLLVAADTNDPRDLAALVDLGLALRENSPYAAVDVLSTVLGALDRSDPCYVDVVLAHGWTLAELGRLSELTDLLHGLGNLGVDRLDVRLLRGHALKLRGELGAAFAPLPEDFDIDAAFPRVDAAAAEVVAELATLEVLSGRLQRATRLLEWVEHNSLAIGPKAQRHMCEVHAVLHARNGSFELGLEAAQRGMSIDVGGGSWVRSRSRPILIEVAMLDAMGRGDEALAALRIAQAEPGPRWNLPLMQLITAITLYRRGEWDDALAEVTAGLSSADDFGIRLGTAFPFAVNILILTARGDHVVANEWLERARDEVTDTALGMEWLMYASAMFTEAHGDQSGALDILRPVIDVCLAVGAPAVLMNLSPDTARLAAALGEADTLQKVAVSLETLAKKTNSPVAHGYKHWVSGWRSGDFRFGERAATMLAECGRLAESARANHDASVMAARADNSTDARRLAGLAFAAYEQLHAEQLHARLRAELRAHGVSMRPRRTPPRATSGWEALTASERRVVQLVGDGMTNGQVAELLFVFAPDGRIPPDPGVPEARRLASRRAGDR